MNRIATVLIISSLLTTGHASDDEYLAFDGSANLGTIAGPVSEQAQERSGGDGSLGVEIIGVWPGSAGDDLGLERGDVIVAINGGTIASLDDLRNEVALAGSGGQVTVTVQRNGSAKDLRGPLGAWPTGRTRVVADGTVERRFRAWQQDRLAAMERGVLDLQRAVEDLERGVPPPTAPSTTPLSKQPIMQALAALPPWRLSVVVAVHRGRTRMAQSATAWDARVLLGTPAPTVY